MRSIGVLSGMRKKKPCPEGRFRFSNGVCVFLRAALLAAVVCTVPGTVLAGENDVTLSTRQDESVIAKDPATGDRVIQTPEPKPQEGYQGPDTVIVSPEIYPGGRPDYGGNRPPQQRPPQQRPPRPKPGR